MTHITDISIRAIDLVNGHNESDNEDTKLFFRTKNLSIDLNGEPTVLVHFVALISNHGIVLHIVDGAVVSYASSLIIVIVYDVLIVIDVSISKSFRKKLTGRIYG